MCCLVSLYYKPPMNQSDAIASCQNGNLQDFTHLYDTYHQSIYAFLYHKTLHTQTAQDLTSDTFFKALQNISHYNPKKSSFRTWLYQIARNTATDHFRTYRMHADIDDIWDIADPTDIPNETDKILQYKKLQHAMAQLTPHQREILTMRYWQGLSFAEISDLTGKSEPSLKMQSSRAIAAMRPHMVTFVLAGILFS